MSERNGDKARFQKNRKRKLLQRQRTRAFMARVPGRTSASHAKKNSKRGSADAASARASTAMQDEGGPIRAGD